MRSLQRTFNSVIHVVVLSLFFAGLTFALDVEETTIKEDPSAVKYKCNIVRKVEIPKHYHEGIYLTDDQIWVANGEDGKVWAFDLKTGALLNEIAPVSTFTEAVTDGPDHSLYTTDWDEKKLYRVSIKDGKFLPDWEASFDPAFPAGCVWDGKNFLVITWTRGVFGTRFHLLTVAIDGNVIGRARFATFQEPAHCAWDGSSLWVTSWYDGHVYQVDVKSNMIAGSFKAPVERLTGIAWDGRYFWLTGTDDDLYQVEVSLK